MKNTFDLHIHSEFSSDGEYDVAALVKMAVGSDLQTIAITDHNSVKGVGLALEAGRQHGIEIVPGIEIDCTFKGIDLHLLGYHIDYHDSRFAQLEAAVFEQEIVANRTRVDKLLSYTDLKLDIESFFQRFGNRIITGEMIAEELLATPENQKNEYLVPYLPGGSRSDMPFVNFYWDYFSQGQIAHVPVKFISFREAVDLIKSTGGIPVIAHAAVNLRDRMDAVAELIEEGAEGLEIYNTYHTPGQSSFLRRLAEQNNLVMTCGSDFHGKTKPNVVLGKYPVEDRAGLALFKP